MGILWQRQRPLVSVRRTLALLLLAAVASPTSSPAADPTQADTSRRAREESIAAIPFAQLDADAQAKVDSVLRQTTFFRRMPVEVVECDPNLYLFLIRHPEVIVEIWRYMDVTDITVDRLSAENFHAEDGAGSVGDIEFLYGDKNRHLLYVTGTYEGPLMPRAVRARCLLFLSSDYNKTPTGKYLVTNRLDLFVDIENPGVDLLARTFHRVFGKTTDHNFSETASFVGQVSRTTEVNAPGMLRLASRLENLDPNIRREFRRHITKLGERGARQTAKVD
ncbi:MAG: hypothetical protein DWQ31_05545 [Planctomycetota bacterium]|nr:MAG: hypothetical protein DWQ31_05545 [Planctomycetota bacterium]REJ92976.1 MAG: hypothetical protein DWQ35_11095 [Planctomycetota bacterium]REK30586.1 MAG: hypothetical protein DWQ42_01725 [Planctomycetota bacterium]REK46010.1 MAG: hypothetical protein DWQ46_07555 [Planctomycetota bacterium]